METECKNRIQKEFEEDLNKTDEIEVEFFK